MTHVECTTCHQSFPVNETLKIDSRLLCDKCAQSDLSALNKSELERPQKQFDPTVCWGCRSDFGSTILPTLQSGLPVCEPCRQAFLNRQYPNWVKLSFAGLVLVAVASLIVNWRFTAAYLEMKRANRELQGGRIEAAAALITSASRHVPESGDLRDGAALYRGIYFLALDKSAEALPYLQQYASKHRDQYAADLVSGAELGAAYDRRDFDSFLAKAQQALAQHKGDPMSTAAVSSAYACKYAVTGYPSFKTQSLQTLEQAKSLAGGKVQQLKEYEERILCRLETREILSTAEYRKRFPSGWKGGVQ